MSTAVVEPSAVGLASTPVRSSIRWWVGVYELTLRSLKSSLREGQLFFSFGSPIVFLCCFYVPLHKRFDRMGLDYIQSLVPLVILQAALFAAMISCEIAGKEAQSGIRDRLAHLPMARGVPVTSRMINVAVRTLFSVAGALLIGWAFGFGLHGSATDTIAFVALALIFAVALSLVTDAVGSSVDHPSSVAQMLMIPELLLVMLSTGLVPLEVFPEWVQPVVRNNPVSIFGEAMRGFADGTGPGLTAVAGWSIGLVLIGLVSVSYVLRRQESA